MTKRQYQDDNALEIKTIHTINANKPLEELQINTVTPNQQVIGYPSGVSITEIFNIDYNYLIQLIIDNIQDNHFSNLNTYEKTLVIKDIRKRKSLIDEEFKAYSNTTSDNALLEKIDKHLRIIDAQIEQWSNLTYPVITEQEYSKFLKALSTMIEFNVNMNALVTYGDFIPDNNMKATLDNFKKKINEFEEEYKQQLTKLPVTKEVDIAYDIHRYYIISSNNREKIEILEQKLLSMNNDIKIMIDSNCISETQNTKFNKKAKVDKLQQPQQDNKIQCDGIVYSNELIKSSNRVIDLKADKVDISSHDFLQANSYKSNNSHSPLVLLSQKSISSKSSAIDYSNFSTTEQNEILPTITGEMLKDILDTL